MRVVRSLGVALAVLGVAVTAAAPVPARPTGPGDRVRLTQIRYEPRAGHGLNGEWTKLTNRRTVAVDLRGWTLTERHWGHRYTFPAKSLAPGGSVWLYSGRGTDGGANLFRNSRTRVRRDDGDLATLRNGRGTRIDTCGWAVRGPGWTNCGN